MGIAHLPAAKSGGAAAPGDQNEVMASFVPPGAVRPQLRRGDRGAKSSSSSRGREVVVPEKRARRTRGGRGREVPRAVLDVGAVSRVATGAELRPMLAADRVVVLKCYANYCRSCKGIAPRFRKVAQAYAGMARFVELDFTKDEGFCRDIGVQSLPFFAIWKNGQFLGGESIAWDRISKLTDRLAKIVDGQ